MSDIQKMKLNAAKAALEYITEDQIVGIGTGSTVNIFIEQLVTIKNKIAGTVASSKATAQKLKALGFQVLDFTSVNELSIYIDSADAYNEMKQLVKGGGGALTQEKILAYNCPKFICIVDATKQPHTLGTTAIPVEVIPLARSVVARQLVKLGGRPEYRDNFQTDNGNIILDVYDWEIAQPMEMERTVKQIPGVVENGIFAIRGADVIIIGNETEAKQI